MEIKKTSLVFSFLLISVMLMGVSFAECEDADYSFDVDIGVCGDGCHNTCPIQDSYLINVPEEGLYSVYVEVHRSGSEQSQPAEDFTITINGVTGLVVEDRPGDETLRTQYAGDFDLNAGDNTVFMDTAAQCPPDTTANSVTVEKICLHVVEEEPVCGNHMVEEDEECDGESNGDLCDNSESSCTYCNSECELITLEHEEEEKKCSSRDEFVQYCDVNWECSGWTGCNDGLMKRTCRDSNHCETVYNKPLEQSGCETMSQVLVEEEKTNSIFILFGVLTTLILLFVLIKLLKK